jgi:hypothetical protein
MDLKAYKGICVFVEQRYGEIQNVSLELIGKAKSLADELGEKVTAVIIGDEVMDKAEMLTHHGADKVIVIEDESLHHYTTEKYTQALVAAIEEKKPEIVMIGATSIGRDLGPRVSARLKTGLTADCTKLEISEERDLLMTRPAFGGNIMATIICTENRPQMATVRPGVMEKLAYDEARKGTIEVMNVAFEKNAADVEILEVLADEEERINWLQRWALPYPLLARPSTPVGSPRTARWGRRVRPYDRTCTLPSASPVPSSTWPAWKKPTLSWRSTRTKVHRSSKWPMWASSVTSTRSYPSSSRNST